MSPRVALALAAALVAGVVMSFGQTFSPDVLAPFFNSAAPVVALAAAVSMAARSVWSHALLGAVAGPLAMIGYYATSDLRGFGVNMSYVILWSTAGVIAGAAIGWAVWTLRESRTRPFAAGAVAIFPGVAIGESAFGLIRNAATTPVVYWWTAIAVGILVLVWLSVTRLRGPSTVAVACAGTILIAAVIYVCYSAI